jgi:hypothetical protein
MATISKQPVTLSVTEVETLLKVLRDTSGAQFAHANRTKSPAIRDYCFTLGTQCNELEATIVRRLFEARS